MSRRPTAVDLLAELVACPSVNPGRGAGGPHTGEARMAALLESLLRDWGASVETHEVAPGRPNLVATFRGPPSAPALMLEAHSDTVGVEGMTIEPFAPVVREGRLYGRGACDTKGPMAAMLAGIREVLDAGPLPCTVHFVSTCDEESGGRGAAALMARGFRADFAIVAEPTGLEIVRAHKGTVRWAIETRGRAAHSSAPELGVNAIVGMAGVVRALAAYADGPLAAVGHPLLGRATLSVGTIDGGTLVNVVPDRCRIEVDRRLVPGETGESALAGIAAVLDRLRAADPGLDVMCEKIESYPPLEQPADSRIAQLASAACARALGRAAFATAPWASNAGFFAAAGVPSVLFGPGSIAQAHTAAEWIETAQLPKAAAAYAAMIRACGGL